MEGPILAHLDWWIMHRRGPEFHDAFVLAFWYMWNWIWARSHFDVVPYSAVILPLAELWNGRQDSLQPHVNPSMLSGEHVGRGLCPAAQRGFSPPKPPVSPRPPAGDGRLAMAGLGEGLNWRLKQQMQKNVLSIPNATGSLMRRESFTVWSSFLKMFFNCTFRGLRGNVTLVWCAFNHFPVAFPLVVSWSSWKSEIHLRAVLQHWVILRVLGARTRPPEHISLGYDRPWTSWSKRGRGCRQ